MRHFAQRHRACAASRNARGGNPHRVAGSEEVEEGGREESAGREEARDRLPEEHAEGEGEVRRPANPSRRNGAWRMKLEELNKLLKAGEWKDVEFKEARTDVPKSAFETVSAFANTHGGRLVFGVAQQGD